MENQQHMPVNGKVVAIDHCISRIVAALNAANIRTIASCCGHQKTYGDIMLKDGRVLIVLPRAPNGREEWKEVLEGSLLNQSDNPESNERIRQQVPIRDFRPSKWPRRNHQNIPGIPDS